MVDPSWLDQPLKKNAAIIFNTDVIKALLVRPWQAEAVDCLSRTKSNTAYVCLKDYTGLASLWPGGPDHDADQNFDNSRSRLKARKFQDSNRCMYINFISSFLSWIAEVLKVARQFPTIQRSDRLHHPWHSADLSSNTPQSDTQNLTDSVNISTILYVETVESPSYEANELLLLLLLLSTFI